MDDFSASVAEMQSTTDPGEVGTESQATALSEELERLRFIIKEDKGMAQWYESGRPCFQAQAGTQNNVTGNSTLYTMTFGTEIFDVDSNFDGTSTFTAPLSGKYQLNAYVNMSGITSAADEVLLQVVTSNRTYTTETILTNSIESSIGLHLSVVADMDASDTATVQVRVIGEASDVVDIRTGGLSTFSGYFVSP